MIEITLLVERDAGALECVLELARRLSDQVHRPAMLGDQRRERREVLLLAAATRDQVDRSCERLERDDRARDVGRL